MFCHLWTHLLFWSEFWCHLQILGLVTRNSPFNFVPSPFFVIFVVRRTTVNTITALTFIWIFNFSFNFRSFLFLLFYWKKNEKKCHLGLKLSFSVEATKICTIFLMVWTRAIYTRRVKIYHGIWWLKKELSMVHFKFFLGIKLFCLSR